MWNLPQGYSQMQAVQQEIDGLKAEIQAIKQELAAAEQAEDGAKVDFLRKDVSSLREQQTILLRAQASGFLTLKQVPGETLEVVLRDPKRIDAFLLALQQVYGDAVMNEAPLLILTNYHVTVFLKRSYEHVTKGVTQGAAPAATEHHSAVPSLASEPELSHAQVGLTDSLLGDGQYGQTLLGSTIDKKYAVKLYDNRQPEAIQAYFNEKRHWCHWLAATVHLPVSKELQSVNSKTWLVSNSKGFGVLWWQPLGAQLLVAHEEFLLHFGGTMAQDYVSPQEALWTFNVSSRTWRQQFASGVIPPPAFGEPLKNQWLFHTGEHSCCGIYIFDFATLSWSKPEVTGKLLRPRSCYLAICHEDSMIMMGGLEPKLHPCPDDPNQWQAATSIEELQKGVPPPYGEQFSKETLIKSASSKAFAATTEARIGPNSDPLRDGFQATSLDSDEVVRLLDACMRHHDHFNGFEVAAMVLLGTAMGFRGDDLMDAKPSLLALTPVVRCVPVPMQVITWGA
ncbi:hypothetical protein WJX82_010764 [Trebouxia sp. C0006]